MFGMVLATLKTLGVQRDADRGDQQAGPDEPGQPGDQGAGRHHALDERMPASSWPVSVDGVPSGGGRELRERLVAGWSTRCPLAEPCRSSGR